MRSYFREKYNRWARVTKDTMYRERLTLADRFAQRTRTGTDSSQIEIFVDAH